MQCKAWKSLKHVTGEEQTPALWDTPVTQETVSAKTFIFLMVPVDVSLFRYFDDLGFLVTN